MAETDVLEPDEDGDEEAKDRRQDIREAIADMRKNVDWLQHTFEQRVEVMDLEARFMFARYESLKRAGFNPHEAMGFLLHGWGGE